MEKALLSITDAAALNSSSYTDWSFRLRLYLGRPNPYSTKQIVTPWLLSCIRGERTTKCTKTTNGTGSAVAFQPFSLSAGILSILHTLGLQIAIEGKDPSGKIHTVFKKNIQTDSFNTATYNLYNIGYGPKAADGNQDTMSFRVIAMPKPIAAGSVPKADYAISVVFSEFAQSGHRDIQPPSSSDPKSKSKTKAKARKLPLGAIVALASLGVILVTALSIIMVKRRKRAMQ